MEPHEWGFLHIHKLTQANLRRFRTAHNKPYQQEKTGPQIGLKFLEKTLYKHRRLVYDVIKQREKPPTKRRSEMAKAMRYFVGAIKRETEKAVLVNYIYATDTMNPDMEYNTTTWLPKSQIEVYHQFADGDKATIWKVPAWLMGKNNLPSITKKIADQVIACETKKAS